MLSDSISETMRKLDGVYKAAPLPVADPHFTELFKFFEVKKSTLPPIESVRLEGDKLIIVMRKDYERPT